VAPESSAPDDKYGGVISHRDKDIHIYNTSGSKTKKEILAWMDERSKIFLAGGNLSAVPDGVDSSVAFAAGSASPPGSSSSDSNVTSSGPAISGIEFQAENGDFWAPGVKKSLDASSPFCVGSPSAVHAPEPKGSDSQQAKSSIAELQKDECLASFFDGTEFSMLSSHAQSMAMAMMDSPMIAIRRHLQMRNLTDEGTRPFLIVRIYSQYDRTNRDSGNRSNNRHSGNE